MSIYEQYFQYKKDKDKQYSFHEYIVYHLYKGNFKAPFKAQKKSAFFTTYSSLFARYLNINSYNLTQNDRDMAKIYIDLLNQSVTNYKKGHALSFLLSHKIREFEWHDMDFSSELEEEETLHHLSQLKNHSNKIISTISNNIYSLKMSKDDPLFSGILDMNHIKTNHSIIDNKVSRTDWDEFKKVDDDLQDIILPIDDNRILKWINNSKNKEASLRVSIKNLINDFTFVWKNYHYQQRSPLINESTFTHDILSPILKFVAPKFFKRWDQARSLSAKDRGVLKYVDVIGMTKNKDNVFENFFVEVSHGPFHENPDQHIYDDNIKLGKLGKDSLDRNGKYFENDNVFLFHLHTDYICTFLMDYKYSPIVRKIPLDRIQIPFYKNDSGFKVLDFIKKLYKYRCIFEGIQRKYEDSSIRRIRRNESVEFMTQNTPKKIRLNK